LAVSNSQLAFTSAGLQVMLEDHVKIVLRAGGSPKEVTVKKEGYYEFLHRQQRMEMAF
jgi:hypothetical protein